MRYEDFPQTQLDIFANTIIHYMTPERGLHLRSEEPNNPEGLGLP
jgi:hypothetical protein